MNNTVDELIQLVKGMEAEAEEALALDVLQKRIPLATITRDCFIKQLWHTGRLAAMLRDGEDYRNEFDRLEITAAAATKGLSLLGKQHD